jgi:hypothetical protein
VKGEKNKDERNRQKNRKIHKGEKDREGERGKMNDKTVGVGKVQIRIIRNH